MKFFLTVLAIYGSAAVVAWKLINSGHWIAGMFVFMCCFLVSISTKGDK